jgi:hypothetical protein
VPVVDGSAEITRNEHSTNDELGRATGMPQPERKR